MNANTATATPSLSSSSALTLTPIQLELLTDQVGARVCNDAAVVEQMAQLVSVMLLERSIMTPIRLPTDPFSDLRLADLKPDVVSERTIAGLDSLRGIREMAATDPFSQDDEI